jgi:formylglycine-generating enzyme required for sulfatase activity
MDRRQHQERLVARVRTDAMTAWLAGPVRKEAMVWVPAQTFTMGSDEHYPEEAPAHPVSVDGFWIAPHQVTNAEYADFADATGYETVAERPLDPADFPGAPLENLQPGSMVFTPTPGPVDLRHLNLWWTWLPGAWWRRPTGPRSDLDGLDAHPVVHIAHEDAEAYAAWAGLALPTEAEWEAAARGGHEHFSYVWGSEPEGPGERLANYWHGDFPWRAEPGYGHTHKVGSFPANGYGLFDMAGNVWEWTTDWYASGHDASPDPTPCCIPRNPRGPEVEASFDPGQPQFRVPRKVIKGGSFLCADSYCQRYRPAGRRPQMVDTGMSHIGFRCVRRRTNPDI